MNTHKHPLSDYFLSLFTQLKWNLKAAQFKSQSTRFINQAFAAGLLCLLVGCSTDIQRSANLTPEQHLAAATQALVLSRSSADPNQVLEHRLKATEHFIQAGRTEDAGRILRDIQVTDVASNVDLRSSVLETRLALLKNESSRALQIVRGMQRQINDTKSTIAQGSQMGTAKKIALLLPSQGPHAEAAKTIRDGFMASYYSQVQQHNSGANIKVYDTGDGSSVETALQQAMSDNVDLVVGPLTKSEVQAVAKLAPSVPVLALNSIGNTHHGKGGKKGVWKNAGHANNPPLYQFGLMPEDEVVAVAEHARRQGHKRALVIAPQNEWGQRMHETFNTIWKAQGGEVVNTVFLNTKNISEKLQTALKTGSSPQNNFDMVFLAASPELGRQIKTLVNHHSGANLAIYATAAVYSGNPTPTKDHELDGVKFCDMPWVLESTQDIQQNRQAVARMWPNATSRSPRHFALGMDAFRLAQEIREGDGGPPLSLITDGAVANGATGVLRLEGERIQRRLTCAKFENGVPVPD